VSNGAACRGPCFDAIEIDDWCALGIHDVCFPSTISESEHVYAAGQRGGSSPFTSRLPGRTKGAPGQALAARAPLRRRSHKRLHYRKQSSNSRTGASVVIPWQGRRRRNEPQRSRLADGEPRGRTVAPGSQP
jgi:hypothetical protein